MVEVTKTATPATPKSIGGAAPKPAHHTKPAPIAGKKTKEELRGQAPSKKTLAAEAEARAKK